MVTRSVLALAIVLACGCQRTLPQVIVHIDADSMVRERARWLRIRILDDAGTMVRDRVLGIGEDVVFPTFVSLTPRGGNATHSWAIELEVFEEEAAPAAEAQGFAFRRAGGLYVDEEVLDVAIVLDARCGLRCPEGQTCSGGACVGACVDVSSGSGAPICGECEACVRGACTAQDELACGCTGDRCVAGECVIAEEQRVQRVAAGLDVTCATQLSGGRAQLYCFGLNDASQLGVAGEPTETRPLAVADYLDVRHIDVGAHRVGGSTAFGCVSLRDGSAECWGRSTQGRIGADDAAVPGPVALDLEVQDFAAGGVHTCFRSPDRRIFCLGRDDEGQLGRAGSPGSPTDTVEVAHPTGGHWVEVRAGHIHTCALDDRNAVWCWGRGQEGQLGIAGDTENRDAPVMTELGSSDFVELAAGGFHTCARRRDGTASCWGGASFGNLGRPVVETLAPPGEVTLDETLSSIACGSSHCCGITPEAALLCWGRNDHGQVGIGTRNDTGEPIPRRVGEGMEWIAWDGGSTHSCAIRADGALYCWGDNTYGQLGLGDVEDRHAPTRVCFDPP
jgi:alpha-tubulin suppressor-like RCC1 family protein